MPVSDKLEHARLLIVDDQEPNVLLLKRLLQKDGFENLVTTTDSSRALTLCKEHDPDLVLLDLQMPKPNGLEVMEQLRNWTEATGRLPTPVLVLTADNTREGKQAALGLGASDFLTKPFDTTEALLRIKNLLTTRLLQLELRNHNDTLEERVVERTHELEQSRYEIAERLALAAEYRDDATGQHARRVGDLSARIARQLDLPEQLVELIRRAAPLHDLGKIAIPDTILLKSGPLTPIEFETMKTHTLIGAKILSDSSSDLLRIGEEIALTHHERWDGTGYPNNLTADQIPITGRIVAAADTFDALVNDRPYKPAWPLKPALEEISTIAGSQLDPNIARALVSLRPTPRAPLPERTTALLQNRTPRNLQRTGATNAHNA